LAVCQSLRDLGDEAGVHSAEAAELEGVQLAFVVDACHSELELGFHSVVGFHSLLLELAFHSDEEEAALDHEAEEDH
jgi:hypothetical protein